MKIGETVVLKSGSTTMTVESFRRDSRVVCVWFDHRDKVHRNAFPSAALKVIER